jgi:SAM-dependent methyltransferase
MRPTPGASGISPRFIALLTAEGLGGKRVLELGCGWGRLALSLAPVAGRVVGLDRDAAALEKARARAARAGLRNVEFHEADVEREEYGRFTPDLVAAHLCVSEAVVARAGRALPSGGTLNMVAFHVDQWRETGKVSRFAFDDTRMETLLCAEGFTPEVIEVERDVTRFTSVEEGLAAAVGLEDRWRADGRWHRYLGFLEAGGRTLTRSHLIVKARMP